MQLLSGSSSEQPSLPLLFLGDGMPISAFFFYSHSQSVFQQLLGCLSGSGVEAQDSDSIS
jgi:hypothetical protein